MMLSIKEYRDKVLGCWYGKNIGGTLGAPLECRRGVYDLSFYTADLSKGALPNDDLDLQLVWLNAAERYGKTLSSEQLADYWLNFVTATVLEYGTGQANLKLGMAPPLSGALNNPFGRSNGAFIRSELWACLAPGHPDMAVRMMLEDAMVDHHSEGIYGALFCAALESAAFAQSDPDTLIDIALSYIPEDCGVRRAIEIVRECKRRGDSWQQARKQVMQKEGGAFGMLIGYGDKEPEPDIPYGTIGYDAPANVAIVMIGWLYGEGDFGESLCIATNCAEDADCTASTLGSLLGILGGYGSLPEKWLEPIGDEINVLCVTDRLSTIHLPKTVGELTDRVCRLMPTFMAEFCDITAPEGVEITMRDELACPAPKMDFPLQYEWADTLKDQPYTIRRDTVMLRALIRPQDGVEIREGEEKKFTVSLDNLLNLQQWVTFHWHVPQSWKVSPGKKHTAFLDGVAGGVDGKVNSRTFTLIPQECTEDVYTITLEIYSQGYLGHIFLPIPLVIGN